MVVPARPWSVIFALGNTLGIGFGKADPSCPQLFVCFQRGCRQIMRMAEHVYKKVEIVGSSPHGFEDAVQNALGRAKKTVRNMRWFEVGETRGYIDDGKIAHWQVTLKIGFTLED
jgi:dodecin